MPVIAPTDLAIRHLKPAQGKQVPHLDKTLKSFDRRVEAEALKYGLIQGPTRTPQETRGAGIIKLSEARATARTIDAER